MPPARRSSPVARPPHHRSAAERSRGRVRPTDRVTLFGRHAVLAALANPQREPIRLLAADPEDPALQAAAAGRQLTPEPATAGELQRLAGADAVHQGLVLVARSLEPADLAAIAAAGQPVLVLDQVEDPRNVGAILRSAAAFGVGGMVMQTRHAAPLNGVCAKAASGALEWVPIALEVNLARSLQTLQEAGYWVAGLDGAGEVALADFRPAERPALVLGAEGRGLRPLVRDRCDQRVRIPLRPPVESLNVAVTAGIVLCHVASAAPRSS